LVILTIVRSAGPVIGRNAVPNHLRVLAHGKVECQVGRPLFAADPSNARRGNLRGGTVRMCWVPF
jgi:hypothetical protein